MVVTQCAKFLAPMLTTPRLEREPSRRADALVRLGAAGRVKAEPDAEEELRATAASFIGTYGCAH